MILSQSNVAKAHPTQTTEIFSSDANSSDKNDASDVVYDNSSGNAYEWYVDGMKVEGQHVSLARGTAYKIEFVVDGENVVLDFFQSASDQIAEYFILDSEKEKNVYIPSNVPVGTIVYLFGIKSGDIIYAYNLYVTVEENPNPDVSYDEVWYVDGVKVEGQHVSLARGWSYEIEFRSEDVSYNDISLVDSASDIFIDSNGRLKVDETCDIQSGYAKLSCAYERTVNGYVEAVSSYLIIDITEHERISYADSTSNATQIDIELKLNDIGIDKIEYTLSYVDILFRSQTLCGVADVPDGANEFLLTINNASAAVYGRSLEIKGINSTGKERYAFSITDFAYNYGAGDGSEENPYEINCERHYLSFLFDCFSDASSKTVHYWKLMTDLDIGDFNVFSTFGFYGVFDGNGHELSGLSIVIRDLSLPVDAKFGWFKENFGTIKNVAFSNVTISGDVWHEGGWAFAGTVCGVNRAGGVIENVKVVGADICVHRNMIRLGGIAGVNQGIIQNCRVGGTDEEDRVSMFSNGDMGGIAGESSGIVQNCTAAVEFEYYPSVNNRSLGCIVGYAPAGTIKNCLVFSSVKITGTDANICPNIGSIVGHIAGSTIIDCEAPNVDFDMSNLSDAQKINCCTDGSRVFGYKE